MDRRRTGIIVVSCALVLVSVLAQAAEANQGGLYRNATSDNGVRASLQGDSNLGGTNAAIIATVRVQNSIFGSAGLYQAGWIKQGSNYTSDCTSGSITGAMVERQNASTGIYLCNTYTGIGNYGDLYQFRIKHVPAGWEAIKENGNILDGPYDLNFAGGYPFAVSEKYNSITSANMKYGPTGSTSWQRYDSGTDNWYVISSGVTFNDGGWSIGDPPSPFFINR